MELNNRTQNQNAPRSRKGCWWLLLALIVLFVLVFPLILRGVGELLVFDDPLEKADMAVALSGDSGDRVSKAAELMRDNFVEGIIITYTSDEARDALINEAVKYEISAGKIYTTYSTVANTVDEAKSVRDLTDERTWDSLVVITDPFHVLRTRIIFRDVFARTNINIQVRSVTGHWYRADSWWKTREGVRVTLQEYLKILFYKFGKY